MGNYRKHPSAMVSVMNYNYIPITDDYDLNDMPNRVLLNAAKVLVVSCTREGVKNAIMAIILSIDDVCK